MRHPLVPVALLLIGLILLCELPFGLVSRCFAPDRSKSHYSHFVARQNWMRVQMGEMPSQRERTLHVVGRVLEIMDSTGTVHPCHGKILLYFSKDCLAAAPLSYGDEILLLSSPKLPSSVDNPHQFDYRRHLRGKGILYTDYVTPAEYRLLGNNSRGLMSAITSLRQRLVEVIRLSTLTPSQQGIAEALFLGWDDDLDEQTSSQFRQAGITHLLCVSGLHVGIVALLAGYALFFIGNHRRGRILKGIVQLLVIWFFVLLTGMAPGTMRAGLMFSFITVGRMFFSRPPTLNAVAASAVVLLVVNPLVLFDIGFQLSYAAVVGIILLVPPLERLLPLPKVVLSAWKPLAIGLRKIYSLFFVSIAAQLATVPFILFYFHQFPLYFLIANMVVVPFAGLLLGSVIVLVAFAWWPALFALLGGAVSFGISIVEQLTSAIAHLPNALVQSIYFDGWMLLMSLLVLLLLGAALANRSWSRLSLSLLAALVGVLYAQHVESHCALQRHFDLYRLGNRTAMEFFAGHQSYLLCDSSVAANPASIDFQTAGNRLWRQTRATTVLPIDTFFSDPHLMVAERFVSFHGVTLRIVDRSNYRERSASRPHLDYLVLRESPRVSVAELQQQYDFDTLLIASQNSPRYRQTWCRQCDSLLIPYKN